MQTDRTPTVLAGRYELEERLGRTGVGMVWRGNDRVLDRTVVVELIHPDLGDDPAFVERFTADARILARLTDPGLTRLLDTGTEDGVRFLVREFIDGESLRDRLARDGLMLPAEAAYVASATLAALGILHDAGLLHLDLNPDNVLLARDGHVRLSGAAVAPAVFAAKPPGAAAPFLDRTALPPELRTGTPPDERTDVYEAGALLFQMLTGAPLAGTPSPRAARRDIPKDLDAAVQRALSPRPDGRFTSAREFADALEPLARQPAGALRSGARDGMASGATLPPAAPRSQFKTWFVVPIGVLLLSVLAIALGLSLGKLEVGGPLGIRPAPEEPSPSPTAGPLEIVGVTTVDPFGDGAENDSGVGLSVDGDASTAWRSENYFDGRLNKPGVGLLFDLGADRTVAGFRLQTPHPGFVFEVSVGDDPSALVAPGGESFTASVITRGTLDPAIGRYVMVWITSVVPAGDGNRAEVAEFKVIGADA